MYVSKLFRQWHLRQTLNLCDIYAQDRDKGWRLPI